MVNVKVQEKLRPIFNFKRWRKEKYSKILKEIDIKIKIKNNEKLFFLLKNFLIKKKLTKKINTSVIFDDKIGSLLMIIRKFRNEIDKKKLNIEILMNFKFCLKKTSTFIF